jgi:hypothetical protein
MGKTGSIHEEERYAYNGLVGEHEGIISLVKPRSTHKNIIKTDLEGKGWEGLEQGLVVGFCKQCNEPSGATN